jgi:hypothetical protein
MIRADNRMSVDIQPREALRIRGVSACFIHNSYLVVYWFIRQPPWASGIGESCSDCNDLILNGIGFCL